MSAKSYIDVNPLDKYAENLLIESVGREHKTYVYKFGKKGVQVDICDEWGLEPYFLVYPLIFKDEHYWEYASDKSEKTGGAVFAVDRTDLYMKIMDHIEYVKNHELHQFVKLFD